MSQQPKDIEGQSEADLEQSNPLKRVPSVLDSLESSLPNDLKKGGQANLGALGSEDPKTLSGLSTSSAKMPAKSEKFGIVTSTEKFEDHGKSEGALRSSAKTHDSNKQMVEPPALADFEVTENGQEVNNVPKSATDDPNIANQELSEQSESAADESLITAISVSEKTEDMTAFTNDDVMTKEPSVADDKLLLQDIKDHLDWGENIANLPPNTETSHDSNTSLSSKSQPVSRKKLTITSSGSSGMTSEDPNQPFQSPAHGGSTRPSAMHRDQVQKQKSSAMRGKERRRVLAKLLDEVGPSLGEEVSDAVKTLQAVVGEADSIPSVEDPSAQVVTDYIYRLLDKVLTYHKQETGQAFDLSQHIAAMSSRAFPSGVDSEMEDEKLMQLRVASYIRQIIENILDKEIANMQPESEMQSRMNNAAYQSRAKLGFNEKVLERTQTRSQSRTRNNESAHYHWKIPLSYSDNQFTSKLPPNCPVPGAEILQPTPLFTSVSHFGKNCLSSDNDLPKQYLSSEQLKHYPNNKKDFPVDYSPKGRGRCEECVAPLDARGLPIYEWDMPATPCPHVETALRKGMSEQSPTRCQEKAALPACARSSSYETVREEDMETSIHPSTVQPQEAIDQQMPCSDIINDGFIKQAVDGGVHIHLHLDANSLRTAVTEDLTSDPTGQPVPTPYTFQRSAEEAKARPGLCYHTSAMKGHSERSPISPNAEQQLYDYADLSLSPPYGKIKKRMPDTNDRTPCNNDWNLDYDEAPAIHPAPQCEGRIPEIESNVAENLIPNTPVDAIKRHTFPVESADPPCNMPGPLPYFPYLATNSQFNLAKSIYSSLAPQFNQETRELVRESREHVRKTQEHMGHLKNITFQGCQQKMHSSRSGDCQRQLLKTLPCMTVEELPDDCEKQPANCESEDRSKRPDCGNPCDITSYESDSPNECVTTNSLQISPCGGKGLTGAMSFDFGVRCQGKFKMRKSASTRSRVLSGLADCERRCRQAAVREQRREACKKCPDVLPLEGLDNIYNQPLCRPLLPSRRKAKCEKYKAIAPEAACLKPRSVIWNILHTEYSEIYSQGRPITASLDFLRRCHPLTFNMSVLDRYVYIYVYNIRYNEMYQEQSEEDSFCKFANDYLLQPLRQLYKRFMNRGDSGDDVIVATRPEHDQECVTKSVMEAEHCPSQESFYFNW